MSTYQVKLDGSVQDFDAVAAAINFEEAGSSKFVLNELAWVAPSFMNLMTFETLANGVLLNKVKVTRHNAPPPTAHTKVWTGAMIVAGHTELVIVWRG